MRERRQTRCGSDRGAVLVHTALALLALVAFTTFVADFGTLWLARRQAQNAADAAAMAGAVALAYDNATDLSDSGPGKQNAYALSQLNLVYGQPPDVNITSDITYPPPGPDVGKPPCPDGLACIRVEVFRNQARANPLPVFFGGLVGLSDQGIRAMAVAQTRPANATDCLKPWAIPDKWLEINPVPKPTWEGTDTYDAYYGSGSQKGQPLPNPDVYRPPVDPARTGFTLASDHGRMMPLKFGNPQSSISPGHFYPVVLTGVGGSNYRYNIANCAGVVYGVGDWLTIEPGNMIGPTIQGVRDLIALDPNARWDTGSQKIVDSCVDNPPCPGGATYKHSPRIVAIPIFDVDIYETGRQGGRTDIMVVNLLGYFLDRVQSNDVIGYLHTVPGLYASSRSTIPDVVAFSKVIMLVR